MAAALTALSLSTTLACVWPKGELDHVLVEGLALKGDDNYTLWPLWIWLFCIVFWFVQDALKVATYWLVLKFDIFQVSHGSGVAQNLLGLSCLAWPGEGLGLACLLGWWPIGYPPLMRALAC
jgi:hypothetical protein